MSKQNGDKARFGKEHKKKLLRRQRNLALRQSLAGVAGNAGPQVHAAEVAAPSTPAAAETKGIPDAIL